MSCAVLRFLLIIGACSDKIINILSVRQFIVYFFNMPWQKQEQKLHASSRQSSLSDGSERLCERS